jgi:hypothetical protein
MPLLPARELVTTLEHPNSRRLQWDASWGPIRIDYRYIMLEGIEFIWTHTIYSIWSAYAVKIYSVAVYV